MSIIKPNMIKINKLMKDSMVKLKERRRKSLKKKNEVLLWSTFNLMLLEYF